MLAKTVKEADSFISKIKTTGKSLGLVPTMGALHKGHLSLVGCCRKENNITVASVFVNPTQFNDPADFKKYPRNPDRDMQMLRQAGCDMVFAPEVKEMYPQPDRRIFDFGKTGRIMEGRFRPGHFNGVAQVVSRLFEILKPDRAYFGKKDIQQLAIIRKMTVMLNLPVEIRACPTLRESDGLAMSSRNVLLSATERKNAALIWQTLLEATHKKDLTVKELKEWVVKVINNNPFLEIEYFEVVNSSDLQPVNKWEDGERELIGCLAVRAGNVRLIDNIFFSNFALL